MIDQDYIELLRCPHCAAQGAGELAEAEDEVEPEEREG